MHPRQASLLSDSESVLSRVAKRSGKKQSEAAKQGGANLFRYTCPETGQDFYLPVKQTPVKSPYTGKSVSVKPEKATLGDVGKELKEDAAAAKNNKSKKASLLDILRGASDDESL